MKKLQLLLLFTILSSFAQTKEPITKSADKNKNIKIESATVSKIEFLEKTNYLEKKLEDTNSLSDKTLDIISTQIESASYNLNIFGLLFGIAAICLGLYVTYIERKIVRISEENKSLLLKNQKIKTEVEDLNKLIQKDIYGLFIKIKNEETSHIIERLTKVPKDISNVLELLLTRELDQSDFVKFKIAYQKLGENDSAYKEKYKYVFFQHYLNLTIKDELLRPEIIDFIETGVRCSFDNDILKSTSDFLTAAIDQGIHNFKSELTNFFKGLSSSEYKNFESVYRVYFEILHSRKNRFELFSLIESSKDTREAKINYGNFLSDEYLNNSPTESELNIFNELDELKKQQKIVDEEEAKKIEAKRLKEEAKKKN